MAILWVLLFPALFFGMVIAFAIEFNKGVKNGIYQKSKAPQKKKKD